MKRLALKHFLETPRPFTLVCSNRMSSDALLPLVAGRLTQASLHITAYDA